MKKTLLTFLAMLVGLGTTQAADTAKLYASNLGNGLTSADGTFAIAHGTIRFGTFPAGFDFGANAEDFAALNAAFTEVHSVSGAISALGTDGFIDIQHTFATNGSYEGTPYDGSAASTADVAGDIAGETIYVWILNNTTPSAATQQAVFSTSQTWPDRDLLFNDVTFSTDTGTSGLAVHLGALATGMDIGAGAPSHRMGGATEPVANVIASRTPATGTVIAGQQVTFSFTAEGTGPFFQQWRKGGEPIPGATGATHVIGAASLADDGNYDVIVTNGANSLASNEVPLDVVTAIPEITGEPDSVIVNVGAPVALTVVATGQAPLVFKWKKGAAIIKNATTATLTIPTASLKDAGEYSCEVTNASGKDTSVKASVVVVENAAKNLVIAQGATATMTVNFAGVGATLQWFNGAVPIAGATGKTLTIKALTVAHSGVYTCQVTLNGQTVVGGTHQLSVFSTGPSLGNVVLPDGIVGGAYAPYPIPVDADVSKTPTGFSATPLPPGLKLDVKAGVIAGTPTKAGVFNVKITAMNSKGKSATVTVPLTINTFPVNLAGNYVGPIARQSALGPELGGRFESMVSATGVVSGKLFLGTANFPIAGVLTITGTDPLTATISATVTAKRPGALLPLTVTFDLANNLLSNGNVTDGTSNVTFQGWRNTFALAPVAANATDYMGLYNFGLGLAEGDPNEGVATVPQGIGFGSFTVAKDGKLAIIGKTPDGEGLTGSTFVGPAGQVLLFQTLYVTKVKGSIQGILTIDDLNNADPADNTLAGAATLSRPANPSLAHRLYKDGFGNDVPFALVIVGGSYRDPKPNLVLGLATGTNNAAFKFVEGGIGLASQVAPNETFNVPLSVQTGNKVSAFGDNPTLLKFTSVVPAKGSFAGNFTLLDDNPVTPAINANELKRNVKFQGLVIPMAGQLVGVGFGLVDQLPAVAGDTPKNTRILSGGAFFELP